MKHFPLVNANPYAWPFDGDFGPHNTALVAGGAISLADGVRLVAERGRLMQVAVPAGEGAMAAILGLDDDVVRQCCAEASAAGVV